MNFVATFPGDDGAAPALSATPGEAAQTRLLAALVCPSTNEPVVVVPLVVAGEAIKEGAIFNPAGALVGRIANFQVDFVRPGETERFDFLRRQTQAGRLPQRGDFAPEWVWTRHDAPGVAYSLAPIPLDDDDELVAVDGDGATIVFVANGTVELQLQAHPWSGIIEVGYGETLRRIDLYRAHMAQPNPVVLELGAAPVRVQLRLTGERNPLSMGVQCLFGGYRRLTGAQTLLRHVKRPKVRGAEFNDDFQQLLAGVPDEGLLLDIGGGNRQIDDPRYINLDYADFAEPDLIGDATKLPLRDGAVDAVYSSGVFEHLTDPIGAGAEATRVLKPGGRAVIGWAFMQPIHSEGHHFYNATPWGVENAFRGLRPIRRWNSTSFEFLVRWGVDVSGLRGQAPEAEIESVLETLRRWDGLIPESQKPYMASSVWVEFEKPI